MILRAENQIYRASRIASLYVLFLLRTEIKETYHLFVKRFNFKQAIAKQDG
jgi:hypothetical protein